MLRFNLRMRLVVINSLTILVIIILSNLISILVFNSYFINFAEKTKNEMELKLNEKLEKASEIALNLINDKMRQLETETTFIAQDKELQKLLFNNVIKRGDLKYDEERKRFYQEYSKSSSKLSFLSLASSLRTEFYVEIGGDTPREIEIVDTDGVVKGVTSALNGSLRQYRESDYSEEIKEVINKQTSFSNIKSFPDGMIIKSYRSVIDVTTRKTGAVILVFPIQTYFANELKKITGSNIVFYNKSRFLNGTFYYVGTQKIGVIDLGPKYNIYEKIIKGDKIVFEDLEIEYGEINDNIYKENVRIAYTPIKNYSNEVIGMLGVAQPKAEMEKSLIEFENQKKQVLKNVLNTVLFVSLTGMFLLLILLYIITKKITQNIYEIEKNVREISDGKLDKRIIISGNDEITELAGNINRMAEELQKSFDTRIENEKNSTLIKLLQSIVHEVKTPLVGIDGFSKISIKKLLGCINEESKEKRKDELTKVINYMETIITESKRVTSYANDLLEYSDKKYTKKLETEKINFKNLVNEVIRENKLLFINNLNVINEVADDIYYELDKNEFKKVIVNVLKNSVEAMKDFDVENYIKVYSEIKEHNLLIKIKDNGVGIQSERLESIFIPLESTKILGTGLGLAIVKEIIKIHNGEIKAESEYGKWTEFTITLPLK